MDRRFFTLPDEVLRLVDRAVNRSDRSRRTAEEFARYVAEFRASRLRRRIEEGGRRRAERDLEIAEDWADLEEDAEPGDKR